MVRYRTPPHTQTKKRGFTTKRSAEAFANTVEVEKLTESKHPDTVLLLATTGLRWGEMAALAQNSFILVRVMGGVVSPRIHAH
jgi:hypothetical protein